MKLDILIYPIFTILGFIFPFCLFSSKVLGTNISILVNILWLLSVSHQIFNQKLLSIKQTRLSYEFSPTGFVLVFVLLEVNKRLSELFEYLILIR